MSKTIKDGRLQITIEELIEELESREYVQGKKQLRHDRHYFDGTDTVTKEFCCLGVAFDACGGLWYDSIGLSRTLWIDHTALGSVRPDWMSLKIENQLIEANDEDDSGTFEGPLGILRGLVGG